MKLITPLSILVPFTLCLACAEDVDSTLVDTEGMYADFQAITDSSDKLFIETSLRVGGDNGTFAELQGDDELVAEIGGSSYGLQHTKRGANRHFYDANIEDFKIEDSVQVQFYRSLEKESALNSSVRLPPAFTPAFTEVADEIEFDRDTLVEVIWDNQDQEMHWEVTGDCIWSRSGTVEDTEKLLLGPEEIEVTSLDEGESCLVELTLERKSIGFIDAAFGEGGSFVGINRRQLRFTSTPGAQEEMADSHAMGGQSADQ